PSFPFKDRNLLVAIIRIGVDMKMEGGGYRKWMNAFDTAINNEKIYKNAKKAKDLFSSIYKAVEMIVKAKNSLDAERRIREFRDTFLLEGVWDEKSDRILGSILEILEEMKEMEDSNTFRIFLSILRDTSYVEKTEGIKGVRVYSYPASAGLSVKKHYIMGLDDKSTSMVLDDYPYLLKDGSRETVDLGSALLSLYSNPSFSSFTYISGTTTAYDGSRLLPVPFLSSTIEVTEVERDSYSEEGEKERKLKPTLSESLSYEVAEHTVMKRRGLKTEVDPLLDSPLEFSVSEIKSWDTCPYKGYAQSILKIRKSEWECEMEDHFEKGNILHETIQKALEEKKSFAAFDEDTLLKHLESALENSMRQNRIPDEGVRLHIKKDIE
ncbi:MAG: PD-(D/E)XK nuclease family protein, partial [Sphaerochaetaceae bacterium]|nr:PD-(D/E)XK nuclease family protein [Sphaerochaetaceae bacterium]